MKNVIRKTKRNGTAIVAVCIKENEWIYKYQLIIDIKNGVKYETTKGAKVILYDNDTRIRTKADGSEDDNLDNLPYEKETYIETIIRKLSFLNGF